MTRSSTVSPLGGPSRAESVAAELADAICIGELLPGYEVNLTDLAHQYRLRPSCLKRRLSEISDSGLFTVLADTLVVAGLDADELRSMHRFHAAVRDDLFAESIELITPSELDRLEALIPRVAVPKGLDGPSTYRALMYTFGAALVELQAALCAPAANPWEMRIFSEIQRTSRRYYGLGWAIVYGAGREPGDAALRLQQQMLDRWREMLACLRAGNRRGARELLRRDAEQSEWIGEHSLAVELDAAAMPFSATWGAVASAVEPGAVGPGVFEPGAAEADGPAARPRLTLIRGGRSAAPSSIVS